MALDYFGQQTYDGDDNTGTSFQFSSYKSKTFACPGSGNRTVEELSINCKIVSGTPKIRVGVYTTAGALVGESDEITVSGSSYSWQGGMSTAQIRPVGGSLGQAVTLTGGTSYKLAFAETNAGDLGIAYQSGGSNGDVNYVQAIDYTTGLPTTIVTSNDWPGWWNMRCGVTQAGGPTSYPRAVSGTLAAASGSLGRKFTGKRKDTGILSELGIVLRKITGKRNIGGSL